MTDSPLQIRIIPVDEVGSSDAGNLILRSRSMAEALPLATPVTLDELLYPGGQFNPAWRDELIDFLRKHASGGAITYAVPGDPLTGDTTVQHLLGVHEAGNISITVEQGTSTAELVRALAAFPSPQIYVDVINLLQIKSGSPFAGGSDPLSSNQTTILTNLVPSAIDAMKRILQRHYGPDLQLYSFSDSGAIAAKPVPLAELSVEHFDPHGSVAIPAAIGDHFYRSSDDLQRLVARLRAPGGCPWDRKQTNESLTRNLIEESYELLEAIESGYVDDMREEMGDFILQAYLHCQIAEESERFTLEDVLDTLITKLVRRHPHVFASGHAEDADHVVQNWDEIKRAERAGKPDNANGGPLGNVPASLPALSRAQTLLKRSRRMGLEPEDTDRRRDSAIERAGSSAVDSDVLEHVLTAIERAAGNGIDAEELLRRWSREFERSFDSVFDETDEVTRP